MVDANDLRNPIDEDLDKWARQSDFEIHLEVLELDLFTK